MGEGTCYTAEPAPSPEPRKCQDQEDLIPLLLLSLIFFIVGINVVTMLWRHLKRFLRALFNRIFPKDKQASCVDSHRMRRRRCVDPKKPRSRVSSRLRHRPNFLLGQPNHPDSWIRDKKDEKASKYCRMPPQCGRAGASTQVPRRLWKERVVRAAEAPAVTALKSQANFYSSKQAAKAGCTTPRIQFLQPARIIARCLRLPKPAGSPTTRQAPGSGTWSLTPARDSSEQAGTSEKLCLPGAFTERPPTTHRSPSRSGDISVLRAT
ncbi:uncharacterized protein SPEM3-like isoform X2 [Tursiops truncatus]|uniref:uncharacterized protein SPEM3-like isoform X2 n=1 Tax=Tursiops truncatus TaxID=9739 RepID=UPI003CCF2E5E